MPNRNVVTPDAVRSSVSTIIDVQEELLADAEALDFLQGYSLEASINERLNQIGDMSAAEELYRTKVGEARVQKRWDGRPTELGRLLALKEQGLAAIAALRAASQEEAERAAEGDQDTDAVTLTDNNMLRQ